MCVDGKSAWLTIWRPLVGFTRSYVLVPRVPGEARLQTDRTQGSRRLLLIVTLTVFLFFSPLTAIQLPAAGTLLFQRLLFVHLHLRRPGRAACAAQPVRCAPIDGQHVADPCEAAQGAFVPVRVGAVADVFVWVEWSVRPASH